ncbi:MAG: hypothetical protein IPM39_09070 [Chloroflexi bacterium]|nr:hypothetical protein [Chloroflexota bacterium]
MRLPDASSNWRGWPEAKKVLEERAQARYESRASRIRGQDASRAEKTDPRGKKAAGQTTAATHSRTQR